MLQCSRTVIILFQHSHNINNQMNKSSLHTAVIQQILQLLFFVFSKIHIMNLGQFDLSSKNLVLFLATAMIADCINFSCLNAHNNQISLCPEVSFNLKFAKCCTLLIMHLVFSSCIICIVGHKSVNR